MTVRPSPSLKDEQLREILSKQKRIALIWSIEDVREVRPDLNDDQAWRVLLRCEKVLDCQIGLTWQTIEDTAEALFPQAAKSISESTTTTERTSP